MRSSAWSGADSIAMGASCPAAVRLSAPAFGGTGYEDLAGPPPSLAPRGVAILGFDGVAALDLTGPLEALSIARFPGAHGEALPCYQPIVVGLERKNFTSESGLIFKADASAESSDSFDTLVIPGGSGLRRPETTRSAASWLIARADATRRIASVSTGIYALAQSGLVDGRPVATHWRFSQRRSAAVSKIARQSDRVIPQERSVLYFRGGRGGDGDDARFD